MKKEVYWFDDVCSYQLSQKGGWCNCSFACCI